VFLKIEAKLLAEPELEEVVIEGLLGDVDLLGCVFQRPSLKLHFLGLLVWDHYSIVEFPPGAHFLDNFRNGTLFCSLFAVGV
jgi:hypothetical protein